MSNLTTNNSLPCHLFSPLAEDYQRHLVSKRLRETAITDQIPKSNMGRIGDGDVHAAYVEFRAKESDKVSQPPCPSFTTSLPLLHVIAPNSLK